MEFERSIGSTPLRFTLFLFIALAVHLSIALLVEIFARNDSEYAVRKPAVTISLMTLESNSPTTLINVEPVLKNSAPEIKRTYAEVRKVLPTKGITTKAATKKPSLQHKEEALGIGGDFTHGNTESPTDSSANGYLANHRVATKVSKEHLPIEAQVIKLLKPEYPFVSRRRSEEGRVVLLLEITDTGSVKNVIPEKSSGSRRLDNAAIKAARNSEFTPAYDNGVPVSSNKKIAFTFNLQN